MTKRFVMAISGHEIVRWSAHDSSYYDYEIRCPYSGSKDFAMADRGGVFRCACGSVFDIEAYLALDKVTG